MVVSKMCFVQQDDQQPIGEMFHPSFRSHMLQDRKEDNQLSIVSISERDERQLDIQRILFKNWQKEKETTDVHSQSIRLILFCIHYKI